MEKRCKEGPCLIKKDCAVLGCMLQNPLICDISKQIYDKLQKCESPYRIKYIISLLQERQPPKVNRTQIDRYYSLLRNGFDLDKQWNHLTPGQKVLQVTVTHKPRQKNYVAINFKGRSDEIAKKLFGNSSPKKKKNRKLSIVGQYLRDKKKSRDTLEETLFLSYQTIEQFDMRKTRNEIVKDMLAQPDPDFHEKE